MNEEDTLRSASDLFGTYRIIPQKGKTERGELLKFFSQKTSKPIPYIAMRLTGVPTEDLYYLRSICIDYEKRGQPFSKCFFGSLKNPLSPGQRVDA